LFKGRPPASVGDALPRVSTGFGALDEALGGGLPMGSVCELLGPATSGKTTLAFKFLAQAQGQSNYVAYVDQAGHLDPDYAYRCGLDLSRLWIGQPADLQEGLAMAEALVHSRGLAAIVLDSPDFFWDDPGQALGLAASLGRVVAPLARSEMVLIFLHETAMASLSALAHHTAVRLRVTREQWIIRHDDVRGYKARVEVLANRGGPPGRTVMLSIEFNGTVHSNNGL
jgi:hypothetical protein